MAQLHLPPEIIDHITDFLHDQPDTLRKCCLVSRSFIARTRKYLFKDIRFEWCLPKDFPKLEVWKETFPDPKESPARHARSLFVGCADIVTDEDAKEGGWIESFSEIVRLELWSGFGGGPVANHSFHPFRVLSKVKHLRVYSTTIPPSELLKFICSFPQLEDLDMPGGDAGANYTDGGEAIVWPPDSQFPPLTGTLVLQQSSPNYIKHLLLAVPGGLHFRKIIWKLHFPEHLEGVMAVVERCSDTLECIDITRPIREYLSTPSFDLSKATKLKEVVFEFDRMYITWITAALKTITSEHTVLRQISIDFTVCIDPPKVRESEGDEAYLQWVDLDRVLVHLCESRECRMRVGCGGVSEETTWKRMGWLLPEMTKKGLIDAVYKLAYN